MQEEGGYKPRLVYNKKLGVAYRKFSRQGHQTHECTKRIVLGYDFIQNALKDPEPAYKLALLKKSKYSYQKYKKLSTNLKLHLHVKTFVADYYGLSFGGRVNGFNWAIV